MRMSSAESDSSSASASFSRSTARSTSMPSASRLAGVEGGGSSLASQTASGWSSPEAHAVNPTPNTFSRDSSESRHRCVFSKSAVLYWSMKLAKPAWVWKRTAKTPEPGARKSTRLETLFETMRHCSEMGNETSPICERRGFGESGSGRRAGEGRREAREISSSGVGEGDKKLAPRDGFRHPPARA